VRLAVARAGRSHLDARLQLQTHAIPYLRFA
jgi:hypothetical protein